jgi:hypothetical protein
VHRGKLLTLMVIPKRCPVHALYALAAACTSPNTPRYFRLPLRYALALTAPLRFFGRFSVRGVQKHCFNKRKNCGFLVLSWPLTYLATYPRGSPILVLFAGPLRLRPFLGLRKPRRTVSKLRCGDPHAGRSPEHQLQRHSGAPWPAAGLL